MTTPTRDEAVRAGTAPIADKMAREIARAICQEYGLNPEEFERRGSEHPLIPVIVRRVAPALASAPAPASGGVERAEIVARQAGWRLVAGRITRSSMRHQGGLFAESWEQACEYDRLPFAASLSPAATPVSEAEPVADALAKGCCSAASPCFHQKHDPTTICEACRNAATRANSASAEAVRDDMARAIARVDGIELDWITDQTNPRWVKYRAKADAVRSALSPAATPVSEAGGEPAWRDVLAERRRQVEAEGWTAEHDDDHGNGEMARAAASYALEHAAWTYTETPSSRLMDAARSVWPWGKEWWKPCAGRRMLVKAAALILAEIERLDRKEGAR